MTIKEFLIDLIAKGSCSFTYTQAKDALGGTDIAVRAVLRRLKQKGELAQPLSGFYVIVSPEYRILGCRPADQFISELMRFIDAKYYIGLLSAAQYHGAAHHRPQQLQVIVDQKRRLIICGRVKIVFITKNDVTRTPIQNLSTPYEDIIVSTPEATALDMITYSSRCGGLDNVLTVLVDLVKKIDVAKLQDLATQSDEVTWIQRLGYLLDLIKANKLSNVLFESLKNHRVRTRMLMSSTQKSLTLKKLSEKLNKKKIKYSPEIKNDKWKLIINKKLELEK